MTPLEVQAIYGVLIFGVIAIIAVYAATEYGWKDKD